MNRVQRYLMGVAASMLGVSQKSDPTGSIMTTQSRGRPQHMADDYKAYANDGFGRNVVAKRAMEMVAQNAASVPLLLQENRGGEWMDVEEHPILDLLERPNPTTQYVQWMEAFILYYELIGNTYVVGNGPGPQAPPSELWFMRPDRVKIIPSDYGVPGAYLFEMNHRTKTFTCDPIKGTSPVLHFKSFNPLNDWYGMPPMRASALQIDQHNNAGEWNMNVLHNSGRPSGALVYAPDGDSGAVLSEPQRRTLEREIDNKIMNPRNASRPLILDGGFSWNEMSLNAKDLDWLEGVRDAARMIALGHGVPPQLLGIPGDNTYSNYEQARLALYEETVLPLLYKTLSSLSAWLLPAFNNADTTENKQDLRLVPDLDQIPALEPRRKEKWDKINAATVLTLNEKREALGYEKLPMPEADEIYIPSTLMPLSTALEPDPVLDPNADPGDAVPGKKPKVKPKPAKPGDETVKASALKLERQFRELATKMEGL